MGAPRVYQVVASLVERDAIGQEAVGILRALRHAGFESRIIVESAVPALEPLTVDYRDVVDELGPDDLLIHHFSLGSRASRTAFALPCRMMLVYHNITPPEYFLGVHDALVRQCYHGRRELLAYRSRVELAIGASEYNRRELEVMGFAPTAVLPPVADLSHLDLEPDSRMLDAFDDERTNVLFVGRLVPNKRADLLIQHFHAYRARFNPHARLLIAGSHRFFETYLAQLHDLIARIGAQHVHLLGEVSAAELAALYDVADVFLCASEHEGFCVPLIEAFATGVPVLAYAATAVPETLDGGGMLYDRQDPAVVAALLDALVADDAVIDRVLAAQEAALARFRARDAMGRVVALVRDVLAQPAKPRPAVDPDFWRQLDLAETLAEIRETRPSAFQALPLPAAGDTRLVADVDQPGAPR